MQPGWWSRWMVVSKTQPFDDAERDRVLQERGLRILRFGNAQVRHQLPAVLAQIAEACGVET